MDQNAGGADLFLSFSLFFFSFSLLLSLCKLDLIHFPSISMKKVSFSLSSLRLRKLDQRKKKGREKEQRNEKKERNRKRNREKEKLCKKKKEVSGRTKLDYFQLYLFNIICSIHQLEEERKRERKKRKKMREKRKNISNELLLAVNFVVFQNEEGRSRTEVFLLHPSLSLPLFLHYWISLSYFILGFFSFSHRNNFHTFTATHQNFWKK